MDVPDSYFLSNQDWDPSYLSELFREEFSDCESLWTDDIQDSDLIIEMERLERYSPVTEDISLDDNQLCEAVEKIEHE